MRQKWDKYGQKMRQKWTKNETKMRQNETKIVKILSKTC